MTVAGIEERVETTTGAGGIWSSDTSVLIGEETPLQINLSAFELDDDSEPPLAEVSEYVSERVAALEQARKSLRNLIHALDRQIQKDTHTVAPVDPMRSLDGVYGISESLITLQTQMSGLERDLNESEHLHDLLVTWLARTFEVSDVLSTFYRTAERDEPGLTDDILSIFLGWAEPSLTTEQLRNVENVLPTFPLPVFGSAPKDLTPLNTFLGGSTYVGAVLGAHQTGGPVLAIFTASAGFLVWFATPSVKVARQATKNYFAAKLGVTTIED